MKKAKEGSFLRRVSVVTRIRDRSRNSGEARQLEINKRMSRTDERMKRGLCSPSLLAHTLSLSLTAQLRKIQGRFEFWLMISSFQKKKL